MLGLLVIKQVEGLPMGSGMASALARMVLVYLDVVYRMAPGYTTAAGSLGSRSMKVEIEGCLITLLEVRYMDDYLALWKFVHPQDSSLSVQINAKLSEYLRQRYPLPLEDDTTDNFLGLTLACNGDGTVAVRPSCYAPPAYSPDLNFPSVMVFTSFLPQTMKKSLVLGILSRVERYTLPRSHKTAALASFIEVLSAHGFTRSVLRRWLMGKSGGKDWIRDCFR